MFQTASTFTFFLVLVLWRCRVRNWISKLFSRYLLGRKWWWYGTLGKIGTRESLTFTERNPSLFWYKMYSHFRLPIRTVWEHRLWKRYYRISVPNFGPNFWPRLGANELCSTLSREGQKGQTTNFRYTLVLAHHLWGFGGASRVNINANTFA